MPTRAPNQRSFHLCYINSIYQNSLSSTWIYPYRSNQRTLKTASRDASKIKASV